VGAPVSVEEKLRILSDRIKSHSSAMLTEEAVKTAIILPFLSALEYDIFDPGEVIPEFVADAVGKKGEKVDYAIKVDGKIRILVECKPIATSLERIHLAQLYRYFSVTSAKFALLTNGRTFHFHTDLEEQNKLDERPFLTFDLSDLQPQLTAELKKFSKSEFSVEGILQTAHKLKYTSLIKKEINAIIDNPSDDFIRLITAPFVTGRFTTALKDQYAPLVRTAFKELIRDSVQTRLTTALAETVEPVSQAEAALESEEEIATTEEEREGFLIVRAVIRDVLRPSRVFMRDQKSYCGILVDNNNRKPLARLHFNRAIKYVGLFDGEKEERVKVDSLDEIYDLADRLRATAKQYVDAVT
jgi:hypothetical protein